jgi:anaerobic ribonucleoside-triphosphate reductase activating protein
MDPVQLAHRLLEVPDTDGVSISGGEPFEQAAACAVLAATVRGAGRSVTVFIGYTFDQIDHSPLPEIKRFLEQTDLLIAGPYVRDLPCDGTHWRGSTNQTVHALTDRMRKLLEGVTSNSEVVEIKTDGKAILLTGFPSEQDRAWLDRLAVGRVN